MIKVLFALCIIVILTGGCESVNKDEIIEAEKVEISRVIHASIGWAATKDTELLYSCFAHDMELFWFSPQDAGTIVGIDAFVNEVESFFLKDEFKAISFEIRELQINLSKSEDVAWYHARLDDFNEWQGQPANWVDVRWTGVLEKRDNRWVIVQMHFSNAND